MRKKIALKLSALLFAFIALESSAVCEEKNAKDWTGNDWMRHYAEDKTTDKLVAMLMATDVAFRFNKEAKVCPPKKVTGGQVLAIVEKFMRAHPELWHNMAQPLIGVALRESFPCPNDE